MTHGKRATESDTERQMKLAAAIMNQDREHCELFRPAWEYSCDLWGEKQQTPPLRCAPGRDFAALGSG
jgi:hypothetical protein